MAKVGRAARILPFATLLFAKQGIGDLMPCPKAPRGGGCPDWGAAACWSSHEGVPWACWTRSLAPAFLSDNAAGSKTCNAWPTPPGSSTPYYDGACLLKAPGLVAARPAPLSWEEAYKKADDALKRMTPAEKHSVMKGIGWKDDPWYERSKWFYVGNTAPIPHLGIPALNFMDAGAGFSLYWADLIGSVTAWPSVLSLAATWDPFLAEVYAIALGTEFLNKGSNSVLGPVVNVHRPARGGRNSESISGEDPYLGSKMAEAYIRGVQSQGVAAIVKHWVFNEQETSRDTYNVLVDDKTAWELYYPPFEAAVKAGASGVMCSYNKAGGTHLCENKKYLNDVLKQSMGFKGFVQSDWWAAHSTLSLRNGLDQEMPGNSHDGAPWFGPDKLKTEDKATVDQAARRVLAAAFRLHLGSTCSPPHCSMAFHRNVSGPAHAGLARALAAESIVLLKNDEDLLPLKRTSGRLAVVGPGAAAGSYNPNTAGQQHGDWATGDFYTVGGSGHVIAGHAVTPLEGIKKRAAELGMQVQGVTSSDLAAATTVARGADVAIIVVGATSGESRDRKDLMLENNGGGLIKAISSVAKKTVVLMEVPGAVVMPWRNSVDAILAMFLGGQEAGSAWADVLFGDHAPSGRLPLMMPETEHDTIAPSTMPDIHYKEGMATSYRNKHFKAAYPFGHGLSYSRFEYGGAQRVKCREEDEGGIACIEVRVKNVGRVPAREVAQLYLELPPEAQHPGPLLKGFQKTPLIPASASQRVLFVLTARDISYYDPHRGEFVQANGKATAHIGPSSRDLPQVVDIELSGDKDNGGWEPTTIAPTTTTLATTTTTSTSRNYGIYHAQPVPHEGPTTKPETFQFQRKRLPSSVLLILCLLWAVCVGILLPLALRKAPPGPSGQQLATLLPWRSQHAGTMATREREGGTSGGRGTPRRWPVRRGQQAATAAGGVI